MVTRKTEEDVSQNNPWICYEKYKKQISNCASKTYEAKIEYIVEKLKI